MQIAEKADAGLLFGEQESAKVAGELLNAGANGNEIVVRTLRSRSLGFDESFLQANVSVESIVPSRGSMLTMSALAGLQEVEIDLGRDAHSKINRAETEVSPRNRSKEKRMF